MTADYKKFLGREETMVLPYFGGATVDAEGRHLRIAEPFEPAGWYRFTVKGRVATANGPADAPDLSARPKVRGHFVDGRLVREGALAELLNLAPEEPQALAPVQARRWHSGELLFEEVSFETDVEGAVRKALGEGQGLHAIKGVPATLRAAYGYLLLSQLSRRTGIACAPGEVRRFIGDVAERGLPAAQEVLKNLEAERELARREMAELQRRRQAAMAADEMRQQKADRVAQARKLRETNPLAFRHQAQQHAWEALDRAGAQLETCRLVANQEQLEVVFRFMNERFICLCHAASLQVIDSGICLGHPPSDRQVTLDSLPSVIKEAIDEDKLVFLRHP